MHFLAHMFDKKLNMPKREDAPKGRAQPLETALLHHVSGVALDGHTPDGHETIYFAMGDFHAAERLFWALPGVYLTATGFQGGFTPNATSHEVGSGMTGHAQVVKLVFDPAQISLEALLKQFWENHDPTQGNKQGGDIGTMYRSAIFTTTPQQLAAATASRAAYQHALATVGTARITTQIEPAPAFYFAEEDHQQYLAKNQGGRAALKGTGVAYRVTDTQPG